MGKETTSAGQGAVLLTVLGAVSQLLGFGYRVALARMVGAQVIISCSCPCTPWCCPSRRWG